MQNQTPPIIDSLQIKIEKAKAELPTITQQAIDSVDWRAIILGMREKKGYSYSQLEDLELETELLLCGMTNPENFPKELMERMKLPRTEVDLLINELNETIFKKIRDKLMGTPFPLGRVGDGLVAGDGLDKEILDNAGIEILQKKEELKNETPLEQRDDMLAKVENPSLISQKLSGSFQIPTVKTEYTLNNMTKQNTSTNSDFKPAKIGSKTDPYRLSPDE